MQRLDKSCVDIERPHLSARAAVQGRSRTRRVDQAHLVLEPLLIPVGPKAFPLIFRLLLLLGRIVVVRLLNRQLVFERVGRRVYLFVVARDHLFDLPLLLLFRPAKVLLGVLEPLFLDGFALGNDVRVDSLRRALDLDRQSRRGRSQRGRGRERLLREAGPLLLVRRRQRGFRRGRRRGAEVVNRVGRVGRRRRGGR